MVSTLQELERLQVVALDVDVVGVEGTVLAVAAAALLHDGTQRRSRARLALTDGVGLTGPGEGVALITLVYLVAQQKAQFVEVDAALLEGLGH